ncbi:MAG: TylF/MycF/NovP-related O-methyltransferase [Phycisphaerales bacterium]
MPSLINTLQNILVPDRQAELAIERLSVRRGDVNELEALYRIFAFSDLPERPERAEDLFNLFGTTIGEGLYICGHLNRCLHLPGDICEFGIAQGATSRLLANEIAATDKSLWLFDSFEGLPEPGDKDEMIDDIFNLGSMKAYTGTMQCSPDEVKANLAAINFDESRVRIKPGWIDETFADGDLPDQVCFAYVDFDFYDPIKITLDYLNKAVPHGGAVIVDDYGFFSSGAATAVDEFLDRTGSRWRKLMPIEPAGKFCILLRNHTDI